MTARWLATRQKWLQILQIATLFFTALAGLGIIALPDTAAQLSKLEQTLVTGGWFGWTLFTAGMIGAVSELWMVWRKSFSATWLVAWCHTVCVGWLFAYFCVAVYGVVTKDPRLFLTPVFIALLTLWHLAFVQRRPREAVVPLPPARVVIPTESAGPSARLQELLDRADDAL